MLFEKGNKNADKATIEDITNATGLGWRVAEILVSRGMGTVEAVEAFLEDGQPLDPFGLKGVDRACDVIEDALSEGMPITVFGDYDCDGICASAILYETLTAMGADVLCMLPSREHDGYGLNMKFVERAIERGGLLITVDCGITNIDEAKMAREGGLKVIITDHHRPVEQLPEADALIDAHVSGEEQFACLCGAGVAFKLSQALMGEDAFDLLDICAVATIADIVPLLGENRNIVKHGLRMINEAPRPGLAALIREAGLEGKEINAGKVAYTLAPRINSAGRMGDAMRGLELLISESEQRIDQLATELGTANADRQAEEEAIINEAKAQAKEQCPNRLTLVIAKKGWHSGVIGIVASRLVELYGRPSVVINIEDDGVCTGSARGIPGTHIFDALNSCADLMLRYGGHEMAGGFSLNEDKLEEFQERFESFCRQYPASTWMKRVHYDCELLPSDVTLKLAKEFCMLAPFGCGNPAATVLMQGVVAKSPTSIGRNNDHQRMVLAKSGKNCDAVVFGRGGHYMQEGVEYDVIAGVDVNEWNNNSKPQCIVREQRLSAKGFESYPSSRRGTFGYAFMKAMGGYKPSGALPVYEDIVSFTCDKLAECVFGRAVLIRTPDAAKALLAGMKERGLLAGANIYMELASEHPSLENVILLAPMGYDNLYEYSDIIYMDSAPVTGEIGSCYMPAHDKYAPSYARQIAMDRNGMAMAYKALALQVNRRYNERGQMLKKASHLCRATEDQVGMAFYVFEKLGFMDYSGGILTIDNTTKRPLEECEEYNNLLVFAKHGRLNKEN